MNRYDQRMKELGATIPYADTGGQELTLSEAELQSIEAKISYSLPLDYREFLHNYGGYSVYAFFPCEPYEGGDANIISGFYGLMPKDHPSIHYSFTLDIIGMYDALSLYKPVELLPIGDDPGGSQICLVLAGEHKGAVYFWDRIEAWNTEDFTGVHFIASSFDEFIHLLKNEDE